MDVATSGMTIGHVSTSWGPEAGVSGKLGFDTQKPGFYLSGGCEATLGPVGLYGEGGIQEHGSLGWGGYGVAIGAKAGCSAGQGWAW